MMNALCDTVAEHGPAGYVPVPMVNLIWTRLQNLTTRFLAALARGPIPPRAKPTPKPTPEIPPESQPQPEQPPRALRKRLTLPCREAWLYRLIPETGFTRFTLQHILADPEFAGFLQANPKLIRILTPLYNAMGIDLPTEFAYKFFYRAQLDSNLTEHECDHVYTGTFDGQPRINHNEVEDWKFMPMDELRHDMQRNPHHYTYWFKLILEQQMQKS